MPDLNSEIDYTTSTYNIHILVYFTWKHSIVPLLEPWIEIHVALKGEYSSLLQARQFVEQSQTISRSEVIKKWTNKRKHHVQSRTVILETNKGSVIRLSVYIQVFSLLRNKRGIVVWNLFCVKWLTFTGTKRVYSRTKWRVHWSVKNLLVIVITCPVYFALLREHPFRSVVLLPN